MDTAAWKARLASCRKVLVGLGEEWRVGDSPEKEKAVREAYDALYRLLQDKDYFVITMATDAVIYDTPLGSRTETVCSVDEVQPETFSCSADEAMMAKMDQIFPVKEKPRDTRWQRIVAPCGNETWRQCSVGCTKDIWEPGEIPDDICPHCGAPLTGNTVDASPYIEEGYLPQWNRYTRWLTGTLNQELVVLELGVGFSKPGVIRFPFEKTVFFNQKAYLYRVHPVLPQITEELHGRAEGIGESSVAWIREVTV